MALLILLWLVTVIWLLVTLMSTVGIVRLRNLPKLDGAGSPPSVSVVLATRDDAGEIEDTVTRLLEQRNVDLTVVVVDDGSTDGTGEILQRLAAGDDRLRIVRVDELPDGWVGKCHALHVGMREARGEWILFTDADVRMTSEVLARAIAAAEREQADHVVLMPSQRDATLLGKACMLMLFMGMPDAFRKANADKGAVGFGAFNLVRAEAWREVGGHETLRMEIVDDHLLGFVLRRAGKRTRAYIATHDLDVDLARTAWGAIRVVEKNAFAIIRYNVLAFAALSVVLGTAIIGAVIGPFTGTPAGIAAGAAMLSLALPGVLFARRGGWPIAAGLLAPLGLLVVLAAGTNSTTKTLWRGGIRWRGRFYPLRELRKGMVPYFART